MFPETALYESGKRLFDKLVADLNRDVPNLEATEERVATRAIEMAGVVQSSFAGFQLPSVVIARLCSAKIIGVT